MAVLIPIAIAIGSAVATVAAVVATVLCAVISVVGTILISIGSVIAVSVSYIVSGVVAGLSFVATNIIAGLQSVWSVVGPTLTNIYNSVLTLSKALYAGMKAFLEFIHFKTILKIHQLAMLVSSDYRDMMRKVFNEIGKYSEALGLGAQFINLAMNDARNIVLDVSSLMGRSYDLSQVQWLSDMNGFVKYMGGIGEHYKVHPEDIFFDLSNHIERPALDAKAGFMQGLLTIVDGITTVADNTVEKVITLRGDLDQAMLHLPKSISEKIYAEINPHLESFDKFIEDEYMPVTETISNAIHILSGTSEHHTDKLNQITHNILNPGDMLSNIDNLSELERIRQEGKIAEISSRAPRRQVREVNEVIDEAHKGLRSIYEGILIKKEQPAYYVKEMRGLRYKPGEAPEIHQSWFVGDF